MKKLIFLPLCLSLCLSSLAQAQQPSNQQAMLEQISQLDTKTLAQAIDQLPQEQKDLLEKALETNNTAQMSSSLDTIFPFIAIAAMIGIFIWKGLITVDNAEFDDAYGFLERD